MSPLGVSKGISVKKEENFSQWYQELILKAELADYSSVSGCMILRPRSYAIWEKIKEFVDAKLKEAGIEDAYFPIFIPQSSFEKEKEHLKGFSPEVAWVTEAGNRKLSEKLAVRPTSETIMYESYAKWIRSWRDLPLRLNQWNNAVRWEFNNPVPFLRSREFLWNEGHSAFATEDEALAEGKVLKQIYQESCEELMALPGLYGRKTDNEKFAGAVFTEKFHYYLQNGRVLEGPCFHHDGQNFSKAYNITFLDKDGNRQYVWQNTYAISTRMLGVMFVIHSDNRGLIVPPRLAENKIVIVPIASGVDDELLKKAQELKMMLAEFSPIVDTRDYITTGEKFYDWELKGIPIRIELGQRELKNKEVTLVKRNTFEKRVVKEADLKNAISETLEEIHNELFKNAESLLYSNIEKADTEKDFLKLIKAKKIVEIPLCRNAKCEETLKEISGGAKPLFISEHNAKGKKCIICGNDADYYVYAAKTY
ncbi:MAG: prolyl-tRNA synthetase [Candidatus Woesearchaeota archaeon]|nr:prolyl-tRNA synthetase [Candidatus Woesearchaeota archaeon]